MLVVPSEPSPAPRAKIPWPYRVVFAANLVMIVFVFAEPTWSRLTQDTWRRGRFVWDWTLSLDVHAVLGYAFLLVVALQILTGFRRAKGAGGARHPLVGKMFVYGGLPLFVVMGLWVIVERGFLLDGASILFAQDGSFIALEMLHVLGLMAVFTVRAVRAIRAGEVLSHVDGMLAMFLSAGILATIRFIYALIWMVGTNPFSIGATYFAACGLTLLELAAVWALAGRLRENRTPLLILGGTSLALAVLGSPLYSIWDAP